jgi:hypothetical protein
MNDEELSNYTKEKLKAVLSEGADGRQIYKSIMSDGKLTADEKQEVCCAIGKYATMDECRKAMRIDPGTLLRGGGGATQFIAAYINDNCKTYLEAVEDKAKQSVSNKDRSSEDVAKDIMTAYTSELPKLSKNAAEFLKASIDVIKQEMPEHAGTAIPKVLGNNLVLRGASTKIAIWAKVGPPNKEAVDMVIAKDEAIEKVRRPLANAQTNLNKAEAQLKKLQEQRDDVGTLDLEKQLLGKQIEEKTKEVEALRKTLESVKKEVEPEVEKVTQEWETKLIPHQPTLDRVAKCMEANNGVQALVNVIDGGELKNEMALQLRENDELVNTFKSTLDQIGGGQIENNEVLIVPMPEVDFEEIQNELAEVERQKIERGENKKKEAVEQRVKTESEIPALMLEKAGPELQKLQQLEQKLEQLRAGTYKPTMGEKFKGLFQKGELTQNLKKSTIEKIDNVKMEIHQKVDAEDLKKVVEKGQKQIEELNKQNEPIQQGAELYEAAVSELVEVEMELERLEAVQTGVESIASVGGEQRESLEKRRENALEVMEKHKKTAAEFQMNKQGEGDLKKQVSVREKLENKQKAAEQKMSPSQKTDQKPSAKSMKV